MRQINHRTQITNNRRRIKTLTFTSIIVIGFASSKTMQSEIFNAPNSSEPGFRLFAGDMCTRYVDCGRRNEYRSSS